MKAQPQHIRILNATTEKVSAFLFNNLDLLKWIALRSWDLPTREGSRMVDFVPPLNADGLYFVRFTREGGGTELAGAVISTGQDAGLYERDGRYYVEVVT